MAHTHTHTKTLRAEVAILADKAKEGNNKKSPPMGFSQIKCLGHKRRISRPSPDLSPLVTHSLRFAKIVFLRIKLKAKVPELDYKG